MIGIEDIVQRYRERTLFLGDDGAVTYAQFGRLIREYMASDPESTGGTTAASSDGLLHLRLDWTAGAFARLLAAFKQEACVFLGNEVPPGDISPFLSHRPLLVLPTGGTTGAARHAVHSVATLCRPYKLEDRPPARLLVLYTAAHIAGLDAFFQALHRGSTLVIPSTRDPESVARAIAHYQVQILPATPTYLNFLLLSGALDGQKHACVRAIPHGAEPMPPGVRQRLKVVFPKVRLVHRFGMTELGALPVRPDPEEPDALFLDEPGYSWKIEEGELLIKSPTRMLGTLETGPIDETDGWHLTGDLAEATPRGSIRVMGRRAGLINVGGDKILPERVEALLLEQPVVLDAAVQAIDNPMTGKAVSAQVIFAGEPDPLALLRALRVSAREKGLSLAHVPTRIVPVGHLEKTAIGKRPRRMGNA